MTETELYAATECAKDMDTTISLIEELLITDSNLINSKLYVDNESELDLCYSRGLSKRSRAFRTRELSLRQRIAHPFCSVNFSMNKIGREENVSDGGTHALPKSGFSRFCKQLDMILLNELEGAGDIDLGNMEELVQKIGDHLYEFVPADVKRREKGVL